MLSGLNRPFHSKRKTITLSGRGVKSGFSKLFHYFSHIEKRKPASVLEENEGFLD
jgi:hypothetical protein